MNKYIEKILQIIIFVLCNFSSNIIAKDIFEKKITEITSFIREQKYTIDNNMTQGQFDLEKTSNKEKSKIFKILRELIDEKDPLVDNIVYTKHLKNKIRYFYDEKSNNNLRKTLPNKTSPYKTVESIIKKRKTQGNLSEKEEELIQIIQNTNFYMKKESTPTSSHTEPTYENSCNVSKEFDLNYIYAPSTPKNLTKKPKKK